MTAFVKNFPFGKNIWIWELWTCVGKQKTDPITPDDYQKIIKKMKDTNIDMALVKCGDGENTWANQWTPGLIKAFHDAGLKIYSWSYVYGVNPQREAEIAMWALDMGADGHVFDAESEYSRTPNPVQSAITMLEAVRKHAPDAILGHSPEPIIDYHPKFPYKEFGKYCDFVMPQVYYGEWKKTPTDGVNWMYQQWEKWEDVWKENGSADSVKPLIPVAQCYDDPVIGFTLTPDAIKEFVQAVAGYKSVSFYEWAHIIRQDCWDAIRDTRTTPPSNDDLGLKDNPNPQNTTPSETVTTLPDNTIPVQAQTPVVLDTQNKQPEDPSATIEETDPVIPTVETAQKVTVPDDGHTVITVKPNEALPSGIEVNIRHHKPHALVVWEFFTVVFSHIRSVKSFFTHKGGEKK